MNGPCLLSVYPFIFGLVQNDTNALCVDSFVFQLSIMHSRFLGRGSGVRLGRYGYQHNFSQFFLESCMERKNIWQKGHLLNSPEM